LVFEGCPDREIDIPESQPSQLGTDEEKAAGGKKGDRKDPHKAIVLCAKTLALKAKELDAGLANAPTGLDRKKFIMASYNGGANMVVQAQKAAIANHKKGNTWSELIDGGQSSALNAGIKKTYAKGAEDGKFAEATSYTTKIYERLTDVK
jgi:hypothetical protein